MNSNSWHDFRQKAARTPQRIALADGEDGRVIRAAAAARQTHVADPVLIGASGKVRAACATVEHAEGLSILDPAEVLAAHEDELTGEFMRLPKNKSLSRSEARQRLLDPLLMGCLQLRLGHVDGFIGGATRTSADTVRAVFSIIGLADHVGTLFGLFLIEPNTAASRGTLVALADCAVIPDPSARQLAHIAIGAASAYSFFTGAKPQVALLSFSTHGSAEHPMVDKVRQALAMAREKDPALAIEGEWQGDAALDGFSAKIKGVGDSPLAGRANVLITPDLNTGNIAYKLVQRLGGCRAVGPILWGAARPANDLSRGCSSEDVLDMIALTSLQAQERGRLTASAKDARFESH